MSNPTNQLKLAVGGLSQCKVFAGFFVCMYIPSVGVFEPLVGGESFGFLAPHRCEEFCFGIINKNMWI